MFFSVSHLNLLPLLRNQPCTNTLQYGSVDALLGMRVLVQCTSGRRREQQRLLRPHPAARSPPQNPQVGLFHGNFVLRSAVPTKLLNLYAYKDDDFTHMRYSVATGDPNDFKDNGFTLRVVHHDPPRRAEFFIVMTMYNEDDTLFVRTMHGVMKNIGYLCKRDRSIRARKLGCRMHHQRWPAEDHFAHAERDRGHRGLPGGHRDQRSQWQTTFRPYIRVYSLKDVEKDANLLFSVSFYAKVAVTEPNKIEGA